MRFFRRALGHVPGAGGMARFHSRYEDCERCAIRRVHARAMTAPDPFAHETRCDLLCFLVIGQLIKHAAGGTWLGPVLLDARMRLWLGSGHPGLTRAEQRTLVRLSIALATVLQSQPVFNDPERLARLSLDTWRLNFHEPLLAALRAACEDRLKRTVAPARSGGHGTLPACGTAEGTASTPCPEVLARAMTLSVAAIRRAQGKRNPQDLSVHSPAWQAVHDDFARDLQRAPRLTPADLHDGTYPPVATVKKGKRKTSRRS